MPDAGDVVVHVDVAAARRVEQIHALAADDVQGLVVEQGRTGSQRLLTAGGKRRLTRSLFCAMSVLETIKGKKVARYKRRVGGARTSQVAHDLSS